MTEAPVSLITGAHGFIGKHLVDYLRTQDHRVYSLDRALFTDFNALEKTIVDLSPNFIFHLGAYGNHFDQRDYDQMLASNVLNTYLLLKCALKTDARVVVFGSSSEYGTKGEAMRERDVCEPVTMYGATKAASSMLAQGFLHTFSLPVTVVRPFSVFGEGESASRFIPKLCLALKTGRSMEVDVHATHDWIYVGDVVEAIGKIIQADTAPSIVNIGSGKKMSNLEVVGAVEKIAGRTLNLVPYPHRPYDSTHWVANVTTLRELNFTPVYGVTCGLKRTYEFYSKD